MRYLVLSVLLIMVSCKAKKQQYWQYYGIVYPNFWHKMVNKKLSPENLLYKQKDWLDSKNKEGLLWKRSESINLNDFTITGLKSYTYIKKVKELDDNRLIISLKLDSGNNKIFLCSSKNNRLKIEQEIAGELIGYFEKNRNYRKLVVVHYHDKFGYVTMGYSYLKDSYISDTLYRVNYGNLISEQDYPYYKKHLIENYPF